MDLLMCCVTDVIIIVCLRTFEEFPYRVWSETTRWYGFWYFQQLSFCDVCFNSFSQKSAEAWSYLFLAGDTI